MFYELGFPRDTNLDGNVVERHASISQENQQRSKCLSNKYQCELRQKRIRDIQVDADLRTKLARDKYDSVMKFNSEAEKKLLEESVKQGLSCE